MSVPGPSRWPWPLRHLLFLGLFIAAHAAGVLAASGVLSTLAPGGLAEGVNPETPALLLVAMLGSIPATALTLFLWRRLEGGNWRELGVFGARDWPGALARWGAGGVLLVGVLALPALVGGWSGRVWLPEGAPSFLRTAALCLAGFFCVGAGEELAFRGFFYRGLTRHIGDRAALFVSSFLFAALHVGNPNVTPLAALNIALAGLVLGGVARATGRLAAPIGLHTGWNFALGALVGLPVSGVPSAGLLRIPVSGPAWWTGGAFGPEGGIVSSVLLGALAAWLLRRPIAGASADPGNLRSAVRAEDPADQNDDAGQDHQR